MPQTSLPLTRRLALRLRPVRLLPAAGNVAAAEPLACAPGPAIPTRWILIPLFAAIAAGMLGEWTDVDRAITHLVYDPDARTFPLRHLFWLDVVMHHWAKYAVATLGFAVLAGLTLSFVLRALAPHRRVLLFLALAMSLAPLSVTVGKAVSTSHCPWDVDEFGGLARYSGGLFTPPTGAKPGRCFPAGHASTGFALMAFCFAAFARRRQRAARIFLLIGLAAGLVLGMGRVLQGAHFVTHVVWSGLFCWAVMVLLYALVLRPRASTPALPAEALPVAERIDSRRREALGDYK